MKKNIFLTLALVFTFVGTTWGQATDAHFEVTSVTINDNYPFVYDGTEKTYITSFVDNCSISDGEITGNKAKNAGDYTATISSICHGHPIVVSGTDTYEEFHVGSVTYNWSILPRDISMTSGYADDKYVTITVNDQKWTGSAINISNVYTIEFEGANLTDADYDVYVTKEETPTTIKDEGRYTIVFTGKGNFTGTITKTFDVKKDMSDGESVTGIHLDIPAQILIDGATTFDFNATVTDKKSYTTLHENEDYTLKFFSSENDANLATDDDNTNDPTPLIEADINTQAKYWIVAEGIAPKYQGKIKKAFYTVKEYQTTTPTGGVEISLHITEPGYPTAADSPSGAVIPGEMQVGKKPQPAVATTVVKAVVPGDFTVTLTEDITFNVVGIESGAFAGCNVLRFIDASSIKDFTPSSLNRNAANGPFAGLPNQTLVYLTGADVEGENYIYHTSTSADDWFCDVYRIYDDSNGNQTGFADATAAKWEVMIPQSFTAYTVKNTRKMDAIKEDKQQGYTTYLPYALPIDDSFKAYTLAYSKTNQLGFVEVTTGTLNAMKPYVIIPSTSGQLLNATNALISKTYDNSTESFVSMIADNSAAVSGEKKYALIGTMTYIEGAGAKDKYIMQKDNVWQQINTDAAGYAETTKSCILAMRAYIEDEGTAPARLYSVFNNADGSTTVIKGMQFDDADASAEIYDLQGRRVNAPQRGGLYIINGKKMIMK